MSKRHKGGPIASPKFNAPGAYSAEAVPFKPRRGVLAALTALFILWIVALLALYWLSVRPYRKASSATGSGADTLPIAPR